MFWKFWLFRLWRSKTFPWQHFLKLYYCVLLTDLVIWCIKRMGVFEHSVLQDDDQEAVVMPNKKGEKFLCFLPKMHNSKSSKLVSHQNTSSLILETEKHVKLKTPDELLEVLKDICLVRVSIFRTPLLTHKWEKEKFL